MLSYRLPVALSLYLSLFVHRHLLTFRSAACFLFLPRPISFDVVLSVYSFLPV